MTLDEAKKALTNSKAFRTVREKQACRVVLDALRATEAALATALPFDLSAPVEPGPDALPFDLSAPVEPGPDAMALLREARESPREACPVPGSGGVHDDRDGDDDTCRTCGSKDGAPATPRPFDAEAALVELLRLCDDAHPRDRPLLASDLAAGVEQALDAGRGAK